MYEIKISDEAESDMDSAFIWYEVQRINLGKDFVRTVSEGFRKIKTSPLAYQRVFKNVRKHLVKKFPYCIYYYINEENKEIRIIAIIHNSRKPFIWKKRK